MTPISRVALYAAGLSDPMKFTFLFVGDILMYGCLAAVVASRRPRWVVALVSWRPFVARMATAGAIMAASGLASQGMMGKIVLPFGPSLVGAGLAYLLLSFVHLPRGPFYWLVNARPMQVVGLLSYSLYLWQQPFLFPAYAGVAVWQTFPQNVALAVLVAAVSYTVIERPFLELKGRMFKSRPDVKVKT